MYMWMNGKNILLQVRVFTIEHVYMCMKLKEIFNSTYVCTYVSNFNFKRGTLQYKGSWMCNRYFARSCRILCMINLHCHMIDMYTHTHIHEHTHIHTHTHKCTHTGTPTCMDMHANALAFLHTFTHTCTTHMHKRVRIRAHMYNVHEHTCMDNS